MRVCAVSIDLDGIGCYYRIHGLGKPPGGLEHTILTRALPRAAALFARLGIPVTWFVVGRDAEHPANAAALADLAIAGHELGNHSYSHPYDLARLPAREVAYEIAECDRVLRAITGGKIRGFRAPGYDVSPVMLDVLAGLGYVYDSSIFPAPAYYAAKGLVMAALALLRRPSGAVMIDPRSQVAPTVPYRPAMTAPWRRGQAPLVELPISVTPHLRVPAIGTSLLVAPALVRDRILAAMAPRPVFNFELHGIDFADAAQDGIPGELIARQPDLRLPASEKVARLEAILTGLATDRAFVTLGEVATETQRVS